MKWTEQHWDQIISRGLSFIRNLLLKVNKSGQLCLNLTTFSDLVYRGAPQGGAQGADLEAHRVGQKKKVLWQKLEVYLVATKECSFACLVGKAFYTYLVLYVLWSCWFVCYLNQHDTKGNKNERDFAPWSQVYNLATCNWDFGNLAIWQLGNLATWQFGNLAIWQLGNLATWQFGNLAT